MNSILKKRDEILIRKKNRAKRIIRISSISLAILVVVVGVLFGQNAIRNKNIKNNKAEDNSFRDNDLVQVSSTDIKDLNIYNDDSLRGNDEEYYINKLEYEIYHPNISQDELQYSNISFTELMDYFDTMLNIQDVLQGVHNTDSMICTYKRECISSIYGIAKWEDSSGTRSVIVELSSDNMPPNSPFKIESDNTWYCDNNIIKISQINGADVAICCYEKSDNYNYYVSFLKNGVGYYLYFSEIEERDVINVIDYFLY